MSDSRKNPRYQSMARVQIPGVLEGDCLLKNISITGCGVKCAGTARVQPDTRYLLEVKPEASSHAGAFQLEVECKWVRGGGSSCEVGFSIIASPKGKQFQHYVDYLAYQHSHA